MGIAARPAVVDARRRIGAWEGDAIVGKGHRGVWLTMVERRSPCARIVRLKGRQVNGLAVVLMQDLAGLKDKVKTFTFDNGREFSRREEMGKNLGGAHLFRPPVMPLGSGGAMRTPMG